MSGATQSEFDALAEAARFCEQRLAAHAQKVVARVRDSERAFDLALTAKTQGVFNVVRCVARAEPNDYRTLRTMLAEGDFARAALVYTAEDEPHLSEGIESYPLSRIDELAASLAMESPS